MPGASSRIHAAQTVSGKIGTRHRADGAGSEVLQPAAGVEEGKAFGAGVGKQPGAGIDGEIAGL